VKDSDCPQKICVKHGWLRYANDVIVCLPNKTILYLTKKIGSRLYNKINHEILKRKDTHTCSIFDHGGAAFPRGKHDS